MTTAPDSVKHTVALARQYAELGYDAGKYFERFAEIACRDDLHGDAFAEALPGHRR